MKAGGIRHGQGRACSPLRAAFCVRPAGDCRPYREAPSERSRCGFTLIELLVSMAILVVIVMIVGMVFQRASVAWDTGIRKLEANMTGRALADYMAQEMSQAVLSTNDSFSASGNSAMFFVLGQAVAPAQHAVRSVVYGAGGDTVTRTENGGAAVEMCNVDGLQVSFVEGPRASASVFPDYVDILVSIPDGGTPSVTVYHQSRAYFANRDRYRF